MRKAKKRVNKAEPSSSLLEARGNASGSPNESSLSAGNLVWDKVHLNPKSMLTMSQNLEVVPKNTFIYILLGSRYCIIRLKVLVFVDVKA